MISQETPPPTHTHTLGNFRKLIMSQKTLDWGLCMNSTWSVLFIGTQFSNLYTAVDTPAKGRVGYHQNIRGGYQENWVLMNILCKHGMWVPGGEGWRFESLCSRRKVGRTDRRDKPTLRTQFCALSTWGGWGWWQRGLWYSYFSSSFIILQLVFLHLRGGRVTRDTPHDLEETENSLSHSPSLPPPPTLSL